MNLRHINSILIYTAILLLSCCCEAYCQRKELRDTINSIQNDIKELMVYSNVREKNVDLSLLKIVEQLNSSLDTKSLDFKGLSVREIENMNQLRWSADVLLIRVQCFLRYKDSTNCFKNFINRFELVETTLSSEFDVSFKVKRESIADSSKFNSMDLWNYRWHKQHYRNAVKTECRVQKNLEQTAKLIEEFSDFYVNSERVRLQENVKEAILQTRKNYSMMVANFRYRLFDRISSKRAKEMKELQLDF